jgi:hypothetical protein
MSNDLIESLSAGDLVPYDPGQPLAPMNHDDWANTGVDLVNERQHAPPALVMFGTPLPQGTTEAQVQATLDQIGVLFVKDMGALKYPANLIGFAAKFFRQSALKSPRQVRANHNFELPSELLHDWLAVDFCNALENIEPGTKRQKQQFLSSAILWLAKLNKQLAGQQNSQPEGSRVAQGGAPNSDPTADLNDAQFEEVVRINDAARIKTMAYLQQLWGDKAEARLQLVDEYYKSLPLSHQQALDVFSTGWVRALNTREVIIGLYQQALTSFPSGAALAAEIEEHQSMMAGPNRRRWMNDDKMGERYRQLIRIRDSS